MQHFIRRSDFETSAGDSGFLVHTPSRPQLAEANDKAFARLEELIRPEEIREEGCNVYPMSCLALTLGTGREGSGDLAQCQKTVEVIRRAGRSPRGARCTSVMRDSTDF